MSPAYLGRVRADHRDRLVVWTLTPDEARLLADVIVEDVPLHDLAHRDADALREAANEIEPDRLAEGGQHG